MKLESTSIEGVYVVTTEIRSDHRGAFARLFCDRDEADAFDGRRIVQANFSRTRARGAVRGLHFQNPPHAEWKQVRCVRGRVFDVAVDLRRGSPTFLRWHAEELSADNARALVIPEGCAHGFQVLDPDSELLYLHSAHFAPDAESGVLCDDPALGIRWPLPIGDMSERDRRHPLITDDFRGIPH